MMNANDELKMITKIDDSFSIIDGKLANTKIRLGKDIFVCAFCNKESVYEVGCNLVKIVTTDTVQYRHVCKKCSDEWLAIFEDGDDSE